MSLGGDLAFKHGDLLAVDAGQRMNRAEPGAGAAGQEGGEDAEEPDEDFAIAVHVSCVPFVHVFPDWTKLSREASSMVAQFQSSPRLRRGLTPATEWRAAIASRSASRWAGSDR